MFGTDGRLKLFNSAFARDLAAVAPRARRGAAHRRVHPAGARATTTSRRPGRASAAPSPSFSEQREAFGGQMMRPDGSDHRLRGDAAARRRARCITFADVTDSKRYERALDERNEALVAADRMKNAFISHVSYELRTPLTNIIGFSELLGNPHIGPLNEKQHEYLGDISASSKTLLAIIDDILDARDDGRRHHGAEAGPRRRAAPSSTRRSSACARRPSAPACRCTSPSPTTPRSFIADEARVRQILYNLLSNAVGFSKPGDTIGITCRREGGMMVFTVEDQGVGIPKDQQWKRVRPLREPQPRLQPPRRRPGAVDRQEPRRAARRHGIARTPSPAAERASLCAFPSTGGLRKHRGGRCPKKALRARYRPVAAPPRSECACPQHTASHVIDSRQRARAACAWASSSRSWRAAAISSRLSGDLGAGKTTLARAVIHALTGDKRRGDPEPDVHAGADLRDAAHAGGASRSLPHCARPPSWRSSASTWRCATASRSSNGRSRPAISCRRTGSTCASTIATAAQRGA